MCLAASVPNFAVHHICTTPVEMLLISTQKALDTTDLDITDIRLVWITFLDPEWQTTTTTVIIMLWPQTRISLSSADICC